MSAQLSRMTGATPAGVDQLEGKVADDPVEAGHDGREVLLAPAGSHLYLPADLQDEGQGADGGLVDGAVGVVYESARGSSEGRELLHLYKFPLFGATRTVFFPQAWHPN